MINEEHLLKINHHVIQGMGSHHGFIYRINVNVSSITLKSEMSTILKPYFLSSVSHHGSYLKSEIPLYIISISAYLKR